MHRVGTHLGHKLVGVFVVEVLVLLRQRIHNVEVLVLGEQGVRVFLVSLRHLSDALVDDDVTLVVDDLVELLRRNSEQVTNLVGQALEVPNVHHRHHQVDVAHALTAHLLLGDFHTATVAHNAFVANALVLAAVAFVILDRTKNPLAEQAIAFGLVGAVVDRLRLQHLSVRGFQNPLWRSQGDGDGVEVAAQLLGVVLLEHG